MKVAKTGAALTALLLIATQGTAVAQDRPEEPGAAAMAYLQRWHAETSAPGVSAAVAVGGRLVFSAGVGQANLEAGTAMDGRSVHNIGSVSKLMSLVAVMQLVERGKVSLDAEIQAYAPWFPRKAHPITLRHILTHTSGIRHYKEGEFSEGHAPSFRQFDTFEESTRFWRDDPLLFDPGTHWLYSSFAVNLLQAVVESASGQPFEQYLVEHVFQPAGMPDTRFDVPRRIVPRRVEGYVWSQKAWQLQNEADENVSYKYASGGMISTDEDLCRFGAALNAGRLLKAATLAEVYRPQLPRDLPLSQQEIDKHAANYPGVPPPSAGLYQGLIFMLGEDAEGRHYVGHTGGVKGMNSRFTNYYGENVVVAVHFNMTDSGSAVDIRQAAEALAQLYLPATARKFH